MYLANEVIRLENLLSNHRRESRDIAVREDRRQHKLRELRYLKWLFVIQAPREGTPEYRN